jgi:hypothetical protein
MSSMLATVDREDRRLHEKGRDAEGYDTYRVYYRDEDDFIMPTFGWTVALAKNQRDAAKAVEREVDGAVPMYSEDLVIGETTGLAEILEIHGYDLCW